MAEKCDNCGIEPEHIQGSSRSRPILLAMDPGPDGCTWFLCGRCYVPQKLNAEHRVVHHDDKPKHIKEKKGQH